MKGLFRREERQTIQGVTWEEHLRADSTKQVGARRQQPQALAQVARGFFFFWCVQMSLGHKGGKEEKL